jgi:peptidoglycan/LPS O-acetylase OafA/YrhL
VKVNQDLVELLVVGGVGLLALIQVGVAVASGGAWTPDATLAIAFALACPMLLRGLLAEQGGKQSRSHGPDVG